MFGVGFLELIIIAVFALVFVGPKRLPEVMKQAGRLFVHLRRTTNEVRATFEQVIREAEDELRREEAESLRKSLQPIRDAHHDLTAYVRQEIQTTPGASAPLPAVDGAQSLAPPDVVPYSPTPVTLSAPVPAATEAKPMTTGDSGDSGDGGIKISPPSSTPSTTQS